MFTKSIKEPIQNATILAGIALAIAIVALFIGLAGVTNGQAE
jgi:hypothetical protein